ncbi:MAG: hypothetical protein GX621_14410, partial [Pirellulaceae bacterium]|nr:hypothetical protein [Pirellulaceae bacterium]
MAGFTRPVTASGDGVSGVNYDQTTLGYDALGRRQWTESADGTVAWNVLDARGLVMSTWVGTDLDYDNNGTMDTAYFRDWLAQNPTATTGPAGTSMFLVSAAIYDYGNDGGDGLVTESRVYFDSGTNDYYATQYAYDWRGRLTDALSPGGVVTHYQYDNLGRTVLTQTYASADFTLSAAELRAQSEYFYDDLGRVYETRVYEVDQATGATPGTVRDYLPAYTWYDSRGRVVKTSDGNGLFQKSEYDGAGRLVAAYTCFDADETAYAAAATVAGDTVVEQTQYYYNAAGRMVAVATFQRLPGDTTTEGELTAAYSYATAQVYWYDGAGRTVASVNYGREDVDSGLTHYFFNGTTGALIDTDANGIPDVAEAAPPQPDSSDDYLVSLTEYNDAGRAYRSIDNLGRIDETRYDDAGRVVLTIQNYDNGTVAETETDQDVTVAYEYSAGRLVTLTAYNAKGDDSDPQNENVDAQATKYLYTSPVNAAWQTAEIYPDSEDVLSQNGDGTWSFTDDNGDHVSTAYDRLGRTIETTDQRGVVHAYTFDTAGRLAADTVTSFGLSGLVDEAVKRLGTTYDDVGRVETVTSFADTAGTTAVNQVKYAYNGWGLLAR